MLREICGEVELPAVCVPVCPRDRWRRGANDAPDGAVCVDDGTTAADRRNVRQRRAG